MVGCEVNALFIATQAQKYENGYPAWVSGWGLTSSGLQSDILQKGLVKTMTNKQCTSRPYKFRSYQITENMLCAQGNNIDACKGDSGGPLAVQVQGQSGAYIQIGIVSWSFGCAKYHYPGVYTKLTALLPWLKETIGIEGKHFRFVENKNSPQTRGGEGSKTQI